MLPVRVFPGCQSPTPPWPAWSTPSSWTRRVTWTSTMSPRVTLPCTWRQWRRWGWKLQPLKSLLAQSGIYFISIEVENYLFWEMQIKQKYFSIDNKMYYRIQNSVAAGLKPLNRGIQEFMTETFKIINSNKVFQCFKFHKRFGDYIP